MSEKIPVKNIYYMLSYAFHVLQEQGYKSVETEEFENAVELCAAILIRGVTLQLKRGLGRSYISETDALSSPKGKIDISESIKRQTMLKQRLICNYDDFSVNHRMNQILRSTMELLLRSRLSAKRKKELRKLMVYFGDIETVDLYSVNWKMNFNRNNQSYQMLMSICYLIFKGLLQTSCDGSTRLMDFLDDQTMNQLYENFLFEYFKQEHKDIKVSAPVLQWQLDNDMKDLLPRMETDVVLTKGNTILILDAKFYGEALQKNQFGQYKNKSGNLYQIFTYVKNKQYELMLDNQKRLAKGKELVDYKLSGMLLYAMTTEEIHPNQDYQMSGNQISVKSLDLNCDFKEIRTQLDGIVTKYFGEEQ